MFNLTENSKRRFRPLCVAALAVCVFPLCGCGTTKSISATEQLVMSDAVDNSVAKIDFTPLAGQKIYFDTKYMQTIKVNQVVNTDYVLSALRQHMMAAGVLMQEKEEEADYVVEARLGALGIDSHEVVYGLPASNAISSAASAAAAVAGAPAMPVIPELSVARRNDNVGAAKLGVFAYERATKEPVWQSGTSVARSTAKDVWFLGVGPFRQGSIYNGRVRFAGADLVSPQTHAREGINGPIAAFRKEMMFKDLNQPAHAQLAQEPADGAAEGSGVQPASAEAPAVQ